MSPGTVADDAPSELRRLQSLIKDIDAQLEGSPSLEKLSRELKDTAASLEEKKTFDNFRAVLLPLSAQWLGQAEPVEPQPVPLAVEVRRGTDPAKIEAAQEVADEVVPACEPVKSKTPDMFALLLESVRGI